MTIIQVSSFISRRFGVFAYWYCEFDVCSFYVFFNVFFSMATVSAVLQPCRTCHMLIVLLACCVVCVFRK